jgi:hypothetical protein
MAHTSANSAWQPPARLRSALALINQSIVHPSVQPASQPSVKLEAINVRFNSSNNDNYSTEYRVPASEYELRSNLPATRFALLSIPPWLLLCTRYLNCIHY